MIENPDLALIDWSRAQFALTAIYHWLFVPLTLGLSFIVAIMESIYVKTGREEWKRITRFWMTLFGINFAIGVATGIILEFEFGTNWSNYSWFVGDIFGAPLAIEGILAFFLESTFIAVMFFGWDKVSKRFHLASSWLVAIGANLSALWILVANAWMQHPVGMTFNPATARNEMLNFRDVLFNVVASDKFLHAISSGFLLSSMFVLGISSWYLLRKREDYLAKRSILIAGVFGLMSSLMAAYTGDASTRTISNVQPVKFASLEGLYYGKENAGLVAFGILKDSGEKIGDKKVRDFAVRFEIPGLLSIMTGGDRSIYVPGIYDLLNGNPGRGLMPVSEKMDRGKAARDLLMDYKKARQENNLEKIGAIEKQFREDDFLKGYFSYFGYASLAKPEEVVPNVSLAFYSFHLMVFLGFYFILVFSLALFFLFNDTITQKKWFLRLALWSVILPYIAGELGWVLAEVGRQPWIIQDLMPLSTAVTRLPAGSVVTTFVLFAVLFTVLLIAEVSIMIRQIKIGPKH